VNHKAGIAVILDARDDAFCEPDTVVELTESDEAGV